MWTMYHEIDSVTHNNWSTENAHTDFYDGKNGLFSKE